MITVISVKYDSLYILIFCFVQRPVISIYYMVRRAVILIYDTIRILIYSIV